MQMIVNEYESPVNLRLIAEFLLKLADANDVIKNSTAAVSTTDAQPAVARNTGSSDTAPSLSAGVATVSEGADVAGEIPEAKSAPSASAKKRGRPAKEKEEPVFKDAAGYTSPVSDGGMDPRDAATSSEEAAPASTPDAAEVPAASSTLTIDDVRAALQKFTAAKGVPAGIELLGLFNAARVSELEPEQYAQFVEKCNA